MQKFYRTVKQGLWVCGLRSHDRLIIQKAVEESTYETAYGMIQELSEGALKYLLGINEEFPYKYLSEECLMVLYSLRRAVPSPESQNPLKLLEHYTTDPKRVISMEQIGKWLDLYLDKKQISIYANLLPSMASNKSVIESPRTSGGRDLISSIILTHEKRFDTSNIDVYLERGDCRKFPEFDRLKIFEDGSFTEYNFMEQMKAEFQARQKDSYKLIQYAYSVIMYRKEKGLKPYLYAKDIPQRGNKHRVPNVPTWHAVIAANFVGNIGFEVVSACCPNTFREMDPRIQPEKFFVSGDFKNSTDEIPFEVARTIWYGIIERVECTVAQKKQLSEIVEYLIGPHVIFSDHMVRANLRPRGSRRRNAPPSST